METMNEISGYMSAGSNDDNQVNPMKTVISSSSNGHAHGSSGTDNNSGRVKNVMNKKTTHSGKNRNNNTSSRNTTRDNSKMDVDDENDNGDGTDQDGDDDDHDDAHENTVKNRIQHHTAKSGKVDLKRFDFIPLRLNEHERKLLHVLENALDVCEYTDVVDVTFSHTRKSKVSRIIDSLVDMLSIASGLIVSNNLSKGEQLLRNKSLNDNVPLFTEIFEIGRR
jgi:hypothetical protein